MFFCLPRRGLYLNSRRCTGKRFLLFQRAMSSGSSDFEMSEGDDSYLEESIGLVTKKKPLKDATNTSSAGRSNKKSASQQYQKLSPLEHILKRPDTYIGSVEKDASQQWIFDEELQQMKLTTVNIVPGLFKIFDEILVNAADNKIRDPSMTKIEVTIDPVKNLIEVKNNGKGIPIEMHDKEKMYIPQLIFGNLLTSSNYDDEEKKVVGGRNGYGAKLANIFSTQFTVETADKVHSYKQVWKNNMSVCGKPAIKELSKPNEFTKISFNPDLAKFHMTELDSDILGIMRRRVYDIAGSVRGVLVYLNGKRLKISNFKQYVEMYVKALEAEKNPVVKSEDGTPTPSSPLPTIVHEIVNDRWELAFAVTNDQFKQVSFVNSIATTSGGTHVQFISDMLVKEITENIKKRNKKALIKPFQIRNSMFLFINCLIENPSFTSQTKEQMTTRPTLFGGKKLTIPEDFIKKILKTEIIANVLDMAAINAEKALAKSDGVKKSRITKYVKLEDANRAGTKDGYKCTLILTEGDSAKALAVAGLAVVGRDYYGCYPLRGKMLNVRDASIDQITKNAEIQAIKEIMGLKQTVQYNLDTIKNLRYGHIMIMTDQDTDGSHIKGLIINFLTTFKGLLECPGFLLEFITPIVKVTVMGRNKKTLSFYSMPEYEKWRETEGATCSWKQKYYKGLGTSSQQEGREYFSDLDRHLKNFHALQGDDNVNIDLAFSKKRADDRKEWLRGYQPGTHLDPEIKHIPISDFIHKELILFSMADNIRSIPSVLDGFKPGQRKVLYGCFKRNLKSEIKVAQLAGYVSEKTGYHHGEQSLVQTIIGLAQDFVGSNNIYLLNPNGCFGTRTTGGKDASAARYIFTELNPITPIIFNPSDDALYSYVQDDEQTVEPEWYLPVIPMILVNGADGIGTGWSTNIPNYNPLDLVANIRHLLNNEPLDEMIPWYRAWNGNVEKNGIDKYKVSGIIEEGDDLNSLVISELPVKMWVNTMKEYLLAGLSGTEKVKPWIKDMREQHGLDVRFEITLTNEEMNKTRQIGLYDRFKLTQSISLSNMVAFDPNGRIKKYDSAEQILIDYFYIRLEYYQKRKDHLSDEMNNKLMKLAAQARFIKMIIDRELQVSNRKKIDIVEDLIKFKFPKLGAKNKMISVSESSAEITQEDIELEEEDEEVDQELQDTEGADIKKRSVLSSYDYLLSMPIYSLTFERYQKLLKEEGALEAELNVLLKKSSKDLWLEDLDKFEQAYKTFLDQDEEKRISEVKAKPGAKKRLLPKRKVIKQESAGPVAKRAKTAVKKESTPPVPGKTSSLKQSTLLSLGQVKAEKEPKFPTIFGKASKFGSVSPSSKSKSVSSKSVFSLDSDDDDFKDIQPVVSSKTTADQDDSDDAANKSLQEVATSLSKKSSIFDFSDSEDEKPVVSRPKSKASKNILPDSDDELVKPKSKAPLKKSTKVKKSILSELENSDDDVVVSEPKRKRVTKPSTKKQVIVDSSEEEEDSFIDDEESEEFEEEEDEDEDEDDYVDSD